MPIDPSAIKADMVYSVAECAAILQKKEQTVRWNIRNKRLEATKGTDKKLRVKGSALIKFINGGTAN